ncbi:Rv2175c family DNA-binding protein [Microbacterium sp. ZW T5_45]|uniref:Rv2175c family DNA-binding protein n=1 Tax=Microbacterium sp. ZW T5_45 TaxID=3378080 RepID=UPI003853E5A5
MSATGNTEIAASDWLTLPDLVEVLDESLGRVRRLIDEHYLVGSKRSGVFAVPAVFIVDGHPLPSLRGTVIALQDAGFSDDELIDWLLGEDDTLGRSPIAALLAGHKSEVRRLARTLA